MAFIAVFVGALIMIRSNLVTPEALQAASYLGALAYIWHVSESTRKNRTGHERGGPV
jgi:hypothetical protein